MARFGSGMSPIPAPGQAIYTGQDPERDVAFSPDGRRIMAVGDDGAIRFLDARTGAAERTDGR